MNFTLAKEIYGSPWYMDAFSLQRMSALLSHIRSGGSISVDSKNNTFGYCNIKGEITIVEDNYDLNKSQSEQNISIINLDGPITKNGGASSNGTKQLSSMLRKFDADSRIIGHILMIDSGGGSVAAIPEMIDAIADAKKPVVAFIDGMMASAALYIASKADYIFAKRDTDMVGSIGTMIELKAHPNESETANGERVVRIYADASTDKNIEFEEAINNLNFTPIKSNILNPLNEKFISDVKENRSGVLSTQLTGKMFRASEVVGSLIDEVGSFEKAISKVVELSTLNSIINQKTKTMNKQELKQNHPDVYQSILDEGATSERERVQAWMNFNEIDSEAVAKGIKDNASVNMSVIAAMSAKAMSNAKLEAIKKDGVENLDTTAEEKAKTAQELEAAKFEQEVYASAGLKIKEV